MVDNYERNIQVAVAEVNPSASADLNEIKLQTGVILRKKKFPILLLDTVLNKFPYPPVPDYWDEERKRAVKNPESEAYKLLIEEVDNQRGMATIDAMIAFGTELLSVPEGFYRPENDEWINNLEAIEVLGISVRRDSTTARYLAWVKFVAITDPSEFNLISSVVQSLVGVPGDKVAEAIDTFPDNTK